MEASSLGDGSNELGSPQEDDHGPAPARAASDSARGLSSDSPLALNQAEAHRGSAFSALPAAARAVWIMDTGAGQHLCPADSLSREILEEVKPCDDIRLSTANGVINARGQVELSFLGASGKFLLLDKTPPVISIGRLVEDHSFAFEWRKGRARLTTPSGREIACTVMGYVPTLAARPTLPTASAASAVPVALAETRGVVTPAAMAADPDVVEGGGTAPAAQSTGACDAAMACAGTDRVGAAGEMTRPALTSAGASSQPHGDGSNELGSPVVAGSLGDGSNEPGSPQEDDGGPAPVRAALAPEAIVTAQRPRGQLQGCPACSPRA